MRDNQQRMAQLGINAQGTKTREQTGEEKREKRESEEKSATRKTVLAASAAMSLFAALKSLVARGEQLAYEGIGTPEPLPDSPWHLQDAVSKQDPSKHYSLFSAAFSGLSEGQIAAARNALKRIRTIRHPNFLQYVESLETDTHLLLVTERVRRLSVVLSEERHDEAVAWGIYGVSKALAFVSDCKMVHRNVCMGAVFVNEGGDWKLAGLESLCSQQELDAGSEPPLVTPEKYWPPEKARGARAAPSAHCADMWGLGCLIWEVYNGFLPRPESLKDMGPMPKALVAQYVTLVGANPKTRPTPAQFIERARQSGKYFDNEFIDASLFLENLAVEDKEKKAAFFAKLPKQIDSFPAQACTEKFLPKLVDAFLYAGAGSSVLAPILKIGKLLDTAEFEAKIVPIVVKLFSSTDRMTRVSLLQNLEQFASYLSTSVVSKDVFPHVASGFSDTVPAMREQTVKSMLLLVPKLEPAIIDSQLLRHLAKCQMDEQPGIRTNTTICLGKIASYLTPATRQRVLASAFLRATKDPFKHARAAGLMALAATQKYYTASDIATKILPSVVPLTIDAEQAVRDQAFSLIRALVAKLERVSKGEEVADDVAGEEAAAANEAASWVGWAGSAMTGFSSKLLAGKAGAAGTVGTAGAAGTPGSAPGAALATTATSASASAVSDQVVNDISDDDEDWQDPMDMDDHVKHKLPASSSSSPHRMCLWSFCVHCVCETDLALASCAQLESAPGPASKALKLQAKKTPPKSQLDTILAETAASAAADDGSWDNDDGGWGDMDDGDVGDWTSDFDSPTKPATKAAAVSPPPSKSAAAPGGWDDFGDDGGDGSGGWGDDDDGDWGNMDEPPAAEAPKPEPPKPAAAPATKSAADRAAEAKARREERKAARLAAAGGGGTARPAKKTSKLGAVRKAD
eukprot:m.45457 g.45457  ORF g.45457 m.45457 type:complete len:914 (+) comp6244_c0_seq4:29-2770(+)